MAKPMARSIIVSIDILMFSERGRAATV
jgi:hypothetical protein